LREAVLDGDLLGRDRAEGVDRRVDQRHHHDAQPACATY
jgi:hypothetical protein